MMKSNRAAYLAGIFLLAGSLSLTGCGYKNQPVPPDTIVPEAIEDLRHSIDEKGLTLTWSFPVKTIAGTDIQAISSFDLYRAVVPLKDFCGTCPIPFADPIEVDGGVTSEESGEIRKATYTTALLRSGHKYFFKVRSRTSWWADSADSNIVSFVWHVPAKAPANLMADAGDNLITLSWQPVTSLVDDRKIGEAGTISYTVFRSESGDAFEPVAEALTSNSYADKRVINGKKYFYKVQSRMFIAGNPVDGGVSTVIDAMAKDMTPPSAPAGVTAIGTDTETKIIWNNTSDKEVAAFKIYRRLASEDTAKVIGEVKSVYTLFIDKEIPATERAYYSVSAVDAAGNESILSREATVRE